MSDNNNLTVDELEALFKEEKKEEKKQSVEPTQPWPFILPSWEREYLQEFVELERRGLQERRSRDSLPSRELLLCIQKVIQEHLTDRVYLLRHYELEMFARTIRAELSSTFREVRVNIESNYTWDGSHRYEIVIELVWFGSVKKITFPLNTR